MVRNSYIGDYLLMSFLMTRNFVIKDIKMSAKITAFATQSSLLGGVLMHIEGLWCSRDSHRLWY